MENYFRMNMTPAQVKAISSLGLAHMGDGVFELLVRSYLCARGGQTVQRLHQQAIRLVKAPAQAQFAEKMLPLLTQEEMDFYRRGKNAHSHAAPKSASPREYAMATGLEALFGALHLLGRQERANEIFNVVMEDLYGI